MTEIRRGKKEEYYQIIDFIDFVFSKNNFPHDFQKMAPNLFRETDESMYNTVNLWDDGVIKASALVYPRTLCVGGRKLKICGIGSVASHPRFRGRGYMTMLFNYIGEELREQGVQLSNLGGKRPRYNHFGYEVAGNSYITSLSPDNIRAVLPEFDGCGYSFVRFGYEDRSLVLGLMDIYASKPVHYDYDYDDFFLRMIMPYVDGYPMAVYGDFGELLGYIAVRPKDKEMWVREICLKDSSMLSDVLMSYAMFCNSRIELKFSERDVANIGQLLDFSSDLSLCGDGMWAVFDWKTVIEALLTEKSEYTSLLRGRLVLDLGDDHDYSVCFDGETVTVEPTTDKPDFSFSSLSAIRALLGPVPSAFFGMNGDSEKLSVVRSWFPLPLTWMNTERV